MRYTYAKRRELDRLIHDANMVNLSNDNTIQFIKQKTGITIGQTQLVERKRILRHQGRDIWNKYKTDDYEYRLEHLHRIAEARRVKESAALQMFRYEDDPKKFFQWKGAAYALLEASRYLAELTDHIPEIDAIGHGYEDHAYGQMEQPLETEESDSTEDPGNRQF